MILLEAILPLKLSNNERSIIEFYSVWVEYAFACDVVTLARGRWDSGRYLIVEIPRCLSKIQNWSKGAGLFI